MKKLIIFILLFKSSLIFSQNFKDEIITKNGYTINCEINLVNDYVIFYHIKDNDTIKNKNISIKEVRDYILDKNSKAEILTTKKIRENNKFGNCDSLKIVTIKKENHITYKDGFAINTEAILATDFKLSFTYKISNGCYFETMLSYDIPLSSPPLGLGFNNHYAYVNLEDPYYYYGRVQIRAGIKAYVSKRFYLSPELLYSYGSFNKRDGIIYNNNDDFFEVTRYKNDYEFLLKWGWTFIKDDFFKDLYMGFGIREKYLNDEVYAEAQGDNPYQSVGPFNKKTSYCVLTLHFGYQIGYCK